MLQNFFSELYVPGCFIQFGTENSVIKSITRPTQLDVEMIASSYRSNNTYFLGGVIEIDSLRFSRAKDSDILKKNYFYLDFDIRKSNPDITDEQIKGDMLEWAIEALKDSGSPYGDWRYIVFTGNGLHFYYFGQPVEVNDNAVWRAGVNSFIDSVEASLGDKFDRACSNPARIARMPGGFNCKSHPKKAVEIIKFQDKTINLRLVMDAGVKRILEDKKTIEAKVSEVQERYPDKDDTYKLIQKIPVGKVMCLLTGWELNKDNKNFSSPGKSGRKGCFVADKGNFISTNGTDHLPHSADGYAPFQLVKTYNKFDNNKTFQWFKERFPEIKRSSDNNALGITVDVSAGYSIKNAFAELAGMQERQLMTGDENLDAWRLLLHGKVTRIGAMPGTGKSKLGYYLTHRLLKKEYRGLFFSTEVQAPEVVAHLLQIQLKKPYLDILEHRVVPPPEIIDSYRDLKVYDVRHTGNMLSRIEQIIKRENDFSEANNGRGVDFVVIDFAQQVTPKSNRYTDIFTWATEWGNQCQEISQKYGVCFIDVCQLSVKGNKDEDEKYGHIPYEGGNKLVQTADIATMISRDKSATGQNDVVTWDVRKSKSMGRRFRLELSYDWITGEYKLLSCQDSRILPGDTGYHNYRV